MRARHILFVIIGTVLLLAASPSAQQPMSLAAIDGLEWRHIGPAVVRRPHRRRRGGRAKAVDHLRRRRVGRHLQDGQQRHDLEAGVRRAMADVALDRRHRDRAVGSEHRLGRHRRAEQPPELVVGRRRLQVARRRQDLAHMGLQRHASHRPRRHPSDQSRHRVTSPRSVICGDRTTERGLYRTTRRRQDWEQVLDDRRRHRRRRRGARRATAARSSPPPTSGGGAAGASSAADRAAASIARSTAATRGRSSQEGLPEGNVGRIGVDISRSASRTSSTRSSSTSSGGVFRSEDRGTTWTRQNSLESAPDVLQPDPHRSARTRTRSGCSPRRCSCRSTAARRSRTDGTGDRIHVDHHALWINPRRSRSPDARQRRRPVLLATTAAAPGTSSTTCRSGSTTTSAIDNRDPYWIYGGTQDNGTWGASEPHLQPRSASLNRDVVNIAYGDGFYTQPDPTRPPDDLRQLAERTDLSRRPRDAARRRASGRCRRIRRRPIASTGARRCSSRRTTRTSSTTAATSCSAPTIAGQTWQRDQPGPDAEPGLEEAAAAWGRSAAPTRCRATTASATSGRSRPSTSRRAQAGVLYVGTDDGNVQMTRDGGKSWHEPDDAFKLARRRAGSAACSRRATPPVPPTSRSTATRTTTSSRTSSGRPTTAATWTSIAGDLPDGMVVNALDEHPRNAQPAVRRHRVRPVRTAPTAAHTGRTPAATCRACRSTTS